MDDEDDLTWDEAVAALEAAEPVELVRPERRVTVIYRHWRRGHSTRPSLI
jgi:hypothetical protein